MSRSSLRARILTGAALWTVGLVGIAGVGLNFAVLHHPQVPIAFHSVFGQVHAVTAIALVCLAFGLLFMRRGVSPLRQLRQRLAAVHDGREARVSGAYPTEIQPLVDDLNVLLEQRNAQVARAVAKAADLAHGLKTPLAVLSHEAQRASAAGHADLGAAITEQVTRMRRQIDYHLAHARSAASAAAPGARANVAASASGLVRALQRLHADRALRIAVTVPSDQTFRGQLEDLEEMLGNLLDNACRWAVSEVRLSSALTNGRLVIDIDDDGPGIEAALRESVLQRGVRADEAGAGSGLGLAIVRDLAEVYGGSITLLASPLGGVRARLELPAA
jgi:signal transduction histidine kinase